FHNHLPVRDLKPVNTSHSTVRKAQSENRSRKHMEDDGMKAALRATYSRSLCTAVTPRSNSRPCWSAAERRRGSRRLLKSPATRPRPDQESARIAASGEQGQPMVWGARRSRALLSDVGCAFSDAQNVRQSDSRAQSRINGRPGTTGLRS